jgi:hypothetical protein
MNREDHLRKVIGASARISIETILRSREYSDRFLASTKKNSIEDEVDKVTNAVVERFIASLRDQGFIEGGKELSEKEFELMFRKSIEEYLDGVGTKKP